VTLCGVLWRGHKPHESGEAHCGRLPARPGAVYAVHYFMGACQPGPGWELGAGAACCTVWQARALRQAARGTSGAMRAWLLLLVFLIKRAVSALLLSA